jgi:hypothetical protein
MHEAILVLVPPGDDIHTIMNRLTSDDVDNREFESCQEEVESIFNGVIDDKTFGSEYPNEKGKPVKSVIKSIDEVGEKLGYEKDPDTGEYGYYYNPDQIGDYYSIGGRYNKNLDIHDRYKQEASHTCGIVVANQNCMGNTVVGVEGRG